MILWIDAQLPPSIAPWLTQNFGVQSSAVRDLGLRDADDEEIFLAARRASAIVMTKDADFPALQQRLGAPPQVIWVTCGNTSNAGLRALLTATLPAALELLAGGEAIVEIRDRSRR